MRLLIWLWLLTGAIAPYASCAHAQAVKVECVPLAVAIQNAAQLRDLDANLEKVIALGKSQSGMPGPHWSVWERELRRMWKGRLTPDQAGQDVYKRCRAQLGDMGRDG